MKLCLALAAVWLLQLPLGSAQILTMQFSSPEQQVQQGARMTSATAQELESQLEKNPEDLAARAKLLGYYYYQWMRPGEAAAKAARRKHILWLIEHHPEAPVTGLSELVIDESGPAMADPEAYQQARKLWVAHLESGKSGVAALANLAKIYQISDKDLAERALLQARQAQPMNLEWDYRLGNLYAMGILGIDSQGLNGQPTSTDPLVEQGTFYGKARKGLAGSKSGTMLSVAASYLFRYGTMLAASETKKAEIVDDAIELVQRAKTVEPGNPNWVQFLAQLQAYKRQTVVPRLNQ